MDSMNSTTGGGSDDCLPPTKEELVILARNIRKINQKYLRGMLLIVSMEKPFGNTISVDLNKLSYKTVRSLQKYVSDCMEEENKKFNFY